MTSSVGAALCGRPGGRQAACRNRAATQGAYGILRTAPTRHIRCDTRLGWAGLARFDPAPAAVDEISQHPDLPLGGRTGEERAQQPERLGPPYRRLKPWATCLYPCVAH